MSKAQKYLNGKLHYVN